MVTLKIKKENNITLIACNINRYTYTVSDIAVEVYDKNECLGSIVGIEGIEPEQFADYLMSHSELLR